MSGKRKAGVGADVALNGDKAPISDSSSGLDMDSLVLWRYDFTFYHALMKVWRENSSVILLPGVH